MQKEDRKIGHLVKGLRKTKGMSQMDLAEILGVSYQQVQKYEKGASRISIERLEQISKALNAPINLFFQPEKWAVSETPAVYGKITDNERVLLQLFRKIKNEKLKNAVLQFLKTVVK